MISIKLSSLKDTKLHEYAVRFLFGGLCTALAGVIAKRFGPGIGGLFLAFPAIFPSGLTLIANHEKKRKAEIGFDGADRGRLAASIDSKGAALGCVGLWGFALTVWLGLRSGKSSFMVILGATCVWLLLSGGLWLLEKHRLFRKP
jgi:drug/metabolite transporter (DMT)-like permease